MWLGVSSLWSCDRLEGKTCPRLDRLLCQEVRKGKAEIEREWIDGFMFEFQSGEDWGWNWTYWRSCGNAYRVPRLPTINTANLKRRKVENEWCLSYSGWGEECKWESGDAIYPTTCSSPVSSATCCDTQLAPQLIKDTLCLCMWKLYNVCRASNHSILSRRCEGTGGPSFFMGKKSKSQFHYKCTLTWKSRSVNRSV